ncbi:hypothetical protein GCM10020255_095630 [Rhodococcus baikonurensis]
MGLEYLFGVVEGPADDYVFKPFWAHDREGERQALLDFLDYVTARREAHPGMHIYHYAAYEKSALLRLAARHGVGEQTVDTLLSENVLVDLYPIVRACLRIGQRSYSIKKLEPLYMGEHGRDGDVTNAAASVVAYADYCELRDGGQADQARELLQGISDYNEYDCESTLRLRDWLAERAAEHGVNCVSPPDRSRFHSRNSPNRKSRSATSQATRPVRHAPPISRLRRSWPLQWDTTIANGSRTGGRISTDWSLRSKTSSTSVTSWW